MTNNKLCLLVTRARTIKILVHAHNFTFAAHHDQQALQDRLEATRREFEAEKEAFDRFKREANGRFEQDRTNLNVLREELNKNKTKLEESR